MPYKRSLQRYRYWYAKLLRLYSKPYHERFGEGMEQTFSDLLRERAALNRGLLSCALWICVETFAGIVRENLTVIPMRNKNIIRIALATAFLLSIPLVAMQFNDEMAWSLTDFIVAGGLLFGAGLTYELIARKAGNIAYRVAVGLAVVTALLLVWVNLAVGIIGSENNPANVMYLGVLAVGIIGAIIARLQPRGMARALFAMALAQILVPVIAMIIWRPQVTLRVVEVFGHLFFVALFVFSALLFRRASATNAQ